MKRLAIALVLIAVLAPALAPAQTIHNVQSATIAWDPVARPVCSCPQPPCAWTQECPAEGQALGALYYQVYTRTDPNDSVGTKYGAATQETQLAMTFPAGQTVYVGIETVWWPKGEDEPRLSAEKSWSNVAADCANGQAFGVRYQPAAPTTPKPLPARPKGIRVVK